MNYELEYINKDGEYDYINVDFKANFYPESTGIGSYEYAGIRGYDKGQDYFSCDDVRWNKSLYTEQQNAIIQKHLDENHEHIEKLLIQNHSISEY
jgi:hypothetical protein